VRQAHGWNSVDPEKLRCGDASMAGDNLAWEGLEERLRSLAPDLILIGLRRDEGDQIGLSLVRHLPNVKVIAFSSDGRDAFVHRMQPQRTVLPDVSPILGS
jgi:hypothetical protein